MAAFDGEKTELGFRKARQIVGSHQDQRLASGWPEVGRGCKLVQGCKLMQAMPEEKDESE